MWYKTVPGVPAAANNVNIADVYQAWIKGVIEDVQRALEESIDDLQEWWQELITLPQTPPPNASKRDVPVTVRYPRSLMDFGHSSSPRGLGAHQLQSTDLLGYSGSAAADYIKSAHERRHHTGHEC